MSGFLLDTNVISELVKVKPEPRVTKWIETTDETLLYLSVLTLGEIRKGIASVSHSRRRAALEARSFTITCRTGASYWPVGVVRTGFSSAPARAPRSR